MLYISRIRIIATQVYKALNELSPKYLQDIIGKIGISDAGTPQPDRKLSAKTLPIKLMKHAIPEKISCS